MPPDQTKKLQDLAQKLQESDKQNENLLKMLCPNCKKAFHFKANKKCPKCQNNFLLCSQVLLTYEN